MRILNDHELRVLGALIEKQIATPDYYPMTLNALVNACNQKNHRDPVVSYDEAPVLRTIESLRGLHLAFVHEGADARVPKYGHTFPKAFELEPSEVAVMCVLMLRGPQTPGELRSRTPHLHAFESLAAVEEVLQRLSTRPEPLVRKLARAPGMKESRYAQLLGGDVNTETTLTEPPAQPEPTPPSATEPDRVAKLEAEIEKLRQQFNDLQTQFAEFRKQFE
jgi:uncharacterized protein YceH (UPF0502 family)